MVGPQWALRIIAVLDTVDRGDVPIERVAEPAIVIELQERLTVTSEQSQH